MDDNNTTTKEKVIESASSLQTPAEEEHDENAIRVPKADAALDFPEGGQGWLCVLGGFFCTFCSFGYANSFGVFVEYYQNELIPGADASKLAWIGSFQYFLLFAAGSVFGRLFDCGYYRTMFAAGIFFFLLGQCMLSLSTEYYQIMLTQAILLGISYGAIFQVGVTVPQQWFFRRRASAMGIVAAGSSTGGIVFPILLSRLIPLIGFPWTMRVVALIGGVFLSLAFVCMKTRLPPSIDVRTHGWKSVQWFDFSAFKQAEFSLYVAGSFFGLLGLYTPFTYADLWSTSRNIPANGYWISILNAGSMFGRVLPGFLADRVGRTNTLLPHLFAAGLLMFFYPLTDNLPGMLLFSLLFGFASRSYVSLIPAAVAQLGPTSTIGTRLGMCFAGSSLGGLFGTPIAGAILGSDNSNWWGMSVYSGVMVCVGAGCILCSRQLTARRWGSQRV